LGCAGFYTSQLAQVFTCDDYRAEPCNGPIAITNVTCTFPSSFLLTRQEIDLEFSKYLESRSDKFRDLKNESTTLKFEKQNCNLFHPSKRAHSVQNKF